MAAAPGRGSDATGARPPSPISTRSRPRRWRPLPRGLKVRVEAVDGSISGPPPRRAGTTIVYLSGPRAPRSHAYLRPDSSSGLWASDRDGVRDQDVDGIVLQGPDRRSWRRRSARRARTACSSSSSTTFAQLPRAGRRCAAHAPVHCRQIGPLRRRDGGDRGESGRRGLTPDLFTALAAVFRRAERDGRRQPPPEPVDPGFGARRRARPIDG